MILTILQIMMNLTEDKIVTAFISSLSVSFICMYDDKIKKAIASEMCLPHIQW